MCIRDSSNTAPTMLMSYHELKFLQAEALCRLNRTSDAEKALKEAVAAGIANAERSVSSAITYMGSKMVVNSEKMTEETANTYFENQVKPLFAVNPLKMCIRDRTLPCNAPDKLVLAPFVSSSAFTS